MNYFLNIPNDKEMVNRIKNIVKCIDIYEDNSSIHFVLEEILGGDLFDHIIHSNDRKLKED